MRGKTASSLMKRISVTVSQHPILAFFLLTVLFSWGPIAVVLQTTGTVDNGQLVWWQLLLVFGAMLLGPAIAGLTLTALAGGRTGLRALWKRQTKWRVAPRWYGVALLTTPAVLFIVLGGLWILSPEVSRRLVPGGDLTTVLIFGLIVGLAAGFIEEIGWTGFGLPRLRDQYGVLVTGSVLGVFWGGWHALADFWLLFDEFGQLWVPRIALWIMALTAYRVLMAWVYERTRSLFVAQLMHASFTGTQFILIAPASPGEHFIWYGPFTVLLCSSAVALSFHLRWRKS